MTNKTPRRRAAILPLCAFAMLFASTADAQTTMSTLLAKYKNYDLPPADGNIEINFLTPLSGVETNPDTLPRDVPLTLVFVEPRLLDTIAGATYTAGNLTERLLHYKQDLSAEGRASLVLAASVYAGTNQQDGRTILAIRRFLQEVRVAYPKLEGVVFVGKFPEAALVRKWPWPRQVYTTPECGNIDFGATNILLIGSEMIAPRTEIPLADLDGNWESVYSQASKKVEVVCAAPPAATASTWQNGFSNASFSLTSQKFIVRNDSYSDFFLVDDAQYATSTSADGKTLTVTVTTALRNAEVSATDKLRPTAMAMPDIYVSRINPKSVAYQHDPTFKDASGQGLYDSSGAPRTLQGPGEPAIVFSPDLERTLLVEYFDNNHAFRIGYYGNRPFRSGAATYPDSDFPVSSYSLQASGARSDWTASSLSTPVNPALADYATWLQQDVSLRAVMAHSNAWGSVYGKSTVDDLNRTVGPYHHWTLQNGIWTPTWTNDQDNALFWFYRSLWMNAKLKGTLPTLMVHSGCEVNTPTSFGQNAESILFYAKTLAITARAKVFYDEPAGWQSYFQSNPAAMFGDVWYRNFLTLSANAKLWQEDYSAVKRAYWWSTVGDYTLRLRYALTVPGTWTAVWEKGSQQETQMYAATYDQYRAKYDQLWPQGWRLYALQPYVVNGNVLYNAVWRPSTEAEVQIYGATYSQYRAQYDQLWGQGWRLKIIEPYVVNGNVLYTAVWRPSTEGEMQIYGASYAQFRAQYDQLWGQGWRLKLLQPYVVNGSVFYTAAWRPSTEGELQMFDVSYTTYRAQYDKLWPMGWRLKLLEPYVLNGQVWYTAVWRSGTDAEKQMYGGTYADYRVLYDSLWDQGWRLRTLQVY